MPLEIGGLDLEPSTIGYIMGAYGAFNGVFQCFFFAKIIRALGEWRVFRNGMLCLIPLFSLPPIINYCARRTGGLSFLTWVLMGLMIILASMMDMAYGNHLSFASLTC